MQAANRSILSLLFTPRYQYPDTFNQMRARVTLAFAVFIELADVLIILSALIASSTPSLTQNAILGAVFGGSLPFAIVIFLIHTGRLRIATYLTALMLTIGSIASFSQGVGSNLILAVALSMLYISLIWQWRGTLVATIIHAVE